MLCLLTHSLCVSGTVFPLPKVKKSNSISLFLHEPKLSTSYGNEVDLEKSNKHLYSNIFSL